MGLNKEAWASDERRRRYIETLDEGFDHSGLRKKYREPWCCGVCSTLVAAGERHGHGTRESR